MIKETLNILTEAGTVELGINVACEAQITAKDENVKIENWYIANDKVQGEVQEIIVNNLSSLILNTIRENAPSLGLPANAVQTIVATILKQVYNEEQCKIF